MHKHRVSRKWAAAGSASTLALITALSSASAAEETRSFTIQSQPLQEALIAFSRQADTNVVAAAELTEGRIAPRVVGEMEPRAALDALLSGAGLQVAAADDGGYTLIGEAGVDEIPQPATVLAQAETGTSTGRTREKIIVTGQKREEYIQDVPIAISAFSQEDLTTAQIAGGPDLITQIPNFTFTKTNFSGYSIQIRGIGTQAISATTDAAVAVALNNTPFIRNRFFEQEFYDLERVEVLRGPQGTLYGRNATAGVVNLLTAKPVLGEDEARLSVDKGNFNSERFEAMVNIPLVDDQVALRFAAASTERDGYARNEITDRPIDGRDLWSTRLSLRFSPDDRLDVNLLYEHFEEDDDRLRSGKQLCNKHTVEDINGVAVGPLETLPDAGQTGGAIFRVQSTFSQGCIRNSLYDTGDPSDPDDNGSFETPNGLSVPYYLPLGAIGLPIALVDPYLNAIQSQDLRVIESTIDPIYQARSDIGQLQVSYQIAENLTLDSETAYATDFVYSLQDFNRFNTAPGAFTPSQASEFQKFQDSGILDEEGVFCDPQLGCSSRLVAVDVSTAESSSFSQEFRLSSSYAGPFNFSVGANFLRFDTEDKYYVFINSITLYSASDNVGSFRPRFPSPDNVPWVPGVSDNRECNLHGLIEGDPTKEYSYSCVYIEPNSIANIQDQGHNYFLSKNPYRLVSYAAFGETYWNITDNLKLTAGLRYTVDRKTAPRIPSWILAGYSRGYPVLEEVEQEWREPTGRLAVDWKPDLSFTEDTLVYGSYARGYKAGGANPPPYVGRGVEISATRPKTFEPEFVDAFEIGSKNTFLEGDLTVNAAAFYYDYEGYQISEIVDRSAFNRNFDAEVWGAELEAEWWALENLRLSLKGGYQKTRIADGEQAVDLMDRTAGEEGWIVVRPFPTRASSCILPAWLYTPNFSTTTVTGLGGPNGGNPAGCELAYEQGVDPVTGLEYVADPTTSADGQSLGVFWSVGTYPGWNPETAPNNGEGFFKDLGGNELPNAPNWTGTLSADYILPLGTDWTLTFHGDFHYQSEGWWRVFNDHDFNRLNEYYTMNLAAILKSEDGWNVMGYIKNVTDETAITGAFLNSDDTGLTTNVFLTEPRLYGVRVTKDWTGGTFLGSLIDGERHDPSKPYKFTVTLGGQVQRHDAPKDPLAPSFVGEYSDNINPLSDQDEDLDWGDGRDIEVAYAPGNGWTFSLGARFGKTNFSKPWSTRQQEAIRYCIFNPLSVCYTNEDAYVKLYEYSIAHTYEREDHTLIDFAVGKDIGIGGLDRSSVSAGVRYADFSSTTDVEIFGPTNWYVDADVAKYVTKLTHDRYSATIDADREFKGVGPVVGWEASKALLGDESTGSFGVDWSLTGGVLYGKRKTVLDIGDESLGYCDCDYRYDRPADEDITIVPGYVLTRSKDVTVPTLGASLGLSYRVDRFTIGAGYRWERYYDVIDGGHLEEQEVDRTIDGPYLNVSVGFGG